MKKKIDEIIQNEIIMCKFSQTNTNSSEIRRIFMLHRAERRKKFGTICSFGQKNPLFSFQIQSHPNYKAPSKKGLWSSCSDREDGCFSAPQIFERKKPGLDRVLVSQSSLSCPPFLFFFKFTFVSGSSPNQIIQLKADLGRFTPFSPTPSLGLGHGGRR